MPTGMTSKCEYGLPGKGGQKGNPKHRGRVCIASFSARGESLVHVGVRKAPCRLRSEGSEHRMRWGWGGR